MNSFLRHVSAYLVARRCSRLSDRIENQTFTLFTLVLFAHASLYIQIVG